MKTVKTYQIKPQEVTRNWQVIDLKNKVLGRTATEIAQLLIGKHKLAFTPHVDCGDYVIVLNAKAVEVTGNKLTDKVYYRHSQYPGGFKQETFDKLMDRNPVKVIEKAVFGMLPKNKLRTARMKRLKVFVGSVHPYQKHVDAIK